MKIWELNTDDINVSSYYLPELEDVEFFTNVMEIMNDEKYLFLKEWKPLVLLKSEQAIDTDFFDILDTGALIVTKEGLSLLQTFWNNKDMEVLPFLNDEKDFYLINIVKTVDCLDTDKSDYEKLDNGLIIDYENLVFEYDKIASLPMFKVPELPYLIFITTAFKTLYDEFGLKGINFSDENLIYVD